MYLGDFFIIEPTIGMAMGAIAGDYSASKNEYVLLSELLRIKINEACDNFESLLSEHEKIALQCNKSSTYTKKDPIYVTAAMVAREGKKSSECFDQMHIDLSVLKEELLIKDIAASL
jgi:hypothetical protein